MAEGNNRALQWILDYSGQRSAVTIKTTVVDVIDLVQGGPDSTADRLGETRSSRQKAPFRCLHDRLRDLVHPHYQSIVQ
jgi:hypothetical protein